jgi:zinc protease
MQLVTSLEAYAYDMFDQSLFFIRYYPKKYADCGRIDQIIIQEIEELRRGNFTDHELARADAQARVDYLAMFEDYESLAAELGGSFLATDDPSYVLTYATYMPEDLRMALVAMLDAHFYSSLCHTGRVLPLAATDTPYWLSLQEASDQEDRDLMVGRERITPLQESLLIDRIAYSEPPAYDAPQAQKFFLAHGSMVLYYHNDTLPMIDLIIEFKAQHYDDPIEKQGCYNLMTALLVEGTERFTAQELADALESRGISFAIKPGSASLSILRDDFAYGLELIFQILCKPIFLPEAIDRVKAQIKAQLKEYWDDPAEYAGQLAREIVYKDHPYARCILGSADHIDALSREDIIACHQRFITPRETKIAIVGDIGRYDIRQLCTKFLGDWLGPAVPETIFPHVEPTKHQLFHYPANRDQIVLCYAGLSIARTHPDYDAMLILDEILTGGTQGSMSSKLFQLREETGLFYSMNGSLLAYADKQPGMMIIKTLVSQDGLVQTKMALEQVLNTLGDELSIDEVVTAQYGLINNFSNFFSSNKQMAATFLFLERFGLPADYFRLRGAQLLACSLPAVQRVVQNMVSIDKLSVMEIGRVVVRD